MRIIIAITCLLFSLSAFTQNKQKTPEIYVDKKGVMRWNDNNREASFYGVNYTVPFAHAYRALGYLNKDRKEAIDKDVYHFSRLGFNAYRIHIWDIEISDGEGKLIVNDHLDLLDYLIAKLRERNIRVLITTMTNFGNGYPERNQNNGAFSYLYDKCEIHSNEKAIAAQRNYVSQLVTHVNPYTQLSYKDDPFIVGFEINNEPCHADTLTQTESYINTMLDAIKKAGNKKPVFYNVSHNMEHVQAYFNTAVQGTTYQWYPIGLVAGRTRKGNFLPFVDGYNIPFTNLKGFENKAKAVYEYDPADITYSYMYPAMTRTFRSQGFQWITQFAYDPIDMAWANSEYQTHFLNLAYTPAKAVSMAIAAEVAYTAPLNKKYEKYPNDTIFDNFHVSYNSDLSELNSPDKFFYSNNTTSNPSDINSLKKIIGHGSSPVVKYEGTGAYFLDQLESGVWRLEVMPDAIRINDPFAKPSLKKEVVTIAWNTWNMEISIPGLGENFTVTAINRGNVHNGLSSGKSISVRPGVYLLKKNDYTPAKDWQARTAWNNITLGEFVAPEAHAKIFSVVHNPTIVIEEGKPLQIEAQIVGPEMPDSVIIYTDKVSFWNDQNKYYKMDRTQGYTYRTTISAEDIKEGKLKYNIIVCSSNKNYTFPSGTTGNPLDWDYTQTVYWESNVTNAASPVSLFTVTDEYSDLETYIMPEWSRTDRKIINSNPAESPTLQITFESDSQSPRFFLRKYVKDAVAGRISRLTQGKEICMYIKNAPEKLSVGFITDKGFTYSAVVNSKQGIVRIPLSALQQTRTALLPHPYPVFLDKYFEPDTQIPFHAADIESFEISFDGEKEKKAEIEIGNIWIE